MWPSCHFGGAGSWSGLDVVGGLLGTLVPLFFLGALVALAALAIYLIQRRSGSARNQPLTAAGSAQSGREIAQARYARGEITREQYRELVGDLGAGKGD